MPQIETNQHGVRVATYYSSYWDTVHKDGTSTRGASLHVPEVCWDCPFFDMGEWEGNDCWGLPHCEKFVWMPVRKNSCKVKDKKIVEIKSRL